LRVPHPIILPPPFGMRRMGKKGSALSSLLALGEREALLLAAALLLVIRFNKREEKEKKGKLRKKELNLLNVHGEKGEKESYASSE